MLSSHGDGHRPMPTSAGRPRARGTSATQGRSAVDMLGGGRRGGVAGASCGGSTCHLIGSLRRQTMFGVPLGYVPAEADRFPLRIAREFLVGLPAKAPRAAAGSE